jgi:hypothetical protein
MPTFSQDDPKIPAVTVKATASPPPQFGAPVLHGVGIQVTATGRDTQAIQARCLGGGGSCLSLPPDRTYRSAQKIRNPFGNSKARLLGPDKRYLS